MSADVVVLGINSTTRKTYTVVLDGAEERLWPYSNSRTYRPRRLIVQKQDGNVASVELSGPQIKKDGTEGANWATECFYGERDRTPWLNSIIGGLA